MYPPTRYPYRPRPQIFRLPPEMLVHIFWVAVTSADNYNPADFPIRYQIRSAISLVCRSWNQLITSTLHFWLRFAIDVSTRESRYPPIWNISLWLQRSGGSLPIDILVAMPNDRSLIRAAHMRGVCNILTPSIHRWGELWFYSDVGTEGFPPDLSLASNLTKLSIDAGVLDEDAVNAIGPAFSNFNGVLRILNLENVTFDWIHLWTGIYGMQLNRLTNLTMQYEGWMQGVLDMFLETQDCLASASIHVDGQFSMSSDYRTFSHNSTAASLSRLRHLRLEIFDADLELFNFLEMENLQDLDITVNWSSIVPRDRREITPLLQFIEAGLHSLRSCRFWCDRVRSNWITVLFRSERLFNIPTYQICNVKFGPDTLNLIDIYASPMIKHRLGRIPEGNPNYFTVGWTDRRN